MDDLRDAAIAAAHRRYNACLAPRDTIYVEADAMHEAVEAALDVVELRVAEMKSEREAIIKRLSEGAFESALELVTDRDEWKRVSQLAHDREAELTEALMDARPYVFNRTSEYEAQWRAETAKRVLRRVDAALGGGSATGCTCPGNPLSHDGYDYSCPVHGPKGKK